MAARLTTGELLCNRSFALLLAVELLAGVAEGATMTTLGWQAYARAHDPLVLGLLGLSEFVPAVLLALPAGHLADRHDRRVIAGLGLLASAAVLLVLAADAASGDGAVWPLYLLAAGVGTANAFANPALDPLLAASVPPATLARAIALASSFGQAAVIAGPALGGIVQQVGAPAPYLLAGVATAVAAGLVPLLPRSVGRAHVDDGAHGATLGDTLAGVRFIAATPPLLGAISLDLMAVLFGGVTALLPVFSSDILHVGAAGNGILRAAPGMGALAVGAVLSVRPLRRRAGVTLFAAVAAYGAATVLFGLSRSFALSMVALAALAGADMISMLLRGTVVPLFTPPSLRGRVSAVERVFIGASNELGAFESGVAAALIGAVGAVVLGGAASIAVAVLWAWRFPSLRRLDRLDEIRPGGSDTPLPSALDSACGE
ncbi:MAG TPA: MFS transporter [Gaiellales bacterium]|nr:MFS transporter [Gaiellales bacterium]